MPLRHPAKATSIPACGRAAHIMKEGRFPIRETAPEGRQESVVGDLGVWQELLLVGAAVLVMGMVCALESWSG